VLAKRWEQWRGLGMLVRHASDNSDTTLATDFLTSKLGLLELLEGRDAFFLYV
jgi:hypothetical protein